MPDLKGKMTKTLSDEDIKSIAEVVKAVLHEELEASLQQVANKLDAVQTELTSLSTRIVSAKGELSALKSDTKNPAILSTNQDKLRPFDQKIADLEDRNGSCNIRVYGLSENAEKDAPVQFLERMIPIWFPALKHLKPEIERP